MEDLNKAKRNEEIIDVPLKEFEGMNRQQRRRQSALLNAQGKRIQRNLTDEEVILNLKKDMIRGTMALVKRLQSDKYEEELDKIKDQIRLETINQLMTGIECLQDMKVEGLKRKIEVIK